MPDDRRGMWTPEVIRADALKYRTKNAWKEAPGAAYDTAKKLGIFDNMTTHMPKDASRPVDIEDAREKARGCKNRTEFKKRYSGLQRRIRKQKLLDEVFTFVGI